MKYKISILHLFIKFNEVKASKSKVSFTEFFIIVRHRVNHLRALPLTQMSWKMVGRLYENDGS